MASSWAVRLVASLEKQKVVVTVVMMVVWKAALWVVVWVGWMVVM